MAKVRPNDRCPCGSGAKYKKCCATGRPRAAASYTSAERHEALLKLDALFVDLVSPEEREALAEEFWEDLPRNVDDPDLQATSDFAFEMYCYFDVQLDLGTVADVALAEEGLLSGGERSYVEVGRSVGMRLHEITAVTPGQTLTLRDLVDGSVRTVRERAGSMTLVRWDVIATRVFPVGACGQPEIDGGILHIQPDRKEELLDLVHDVLESVGPGESPLAAREDLAVLFHETWRAPFEVPRLVNHDGHELVETRVFFDLKDAPSALASLDVMTELERDDPASERWTWKGVGTERPEPILRGFVERKGERLVLHTNSRERAQTGREMLEAALGSAIAHRVTETSDTKAAVERAIASGGKPAAAPIPSAEVAAHIEAMLRSHYATWLDQPIPMFDGMTPRQAGASDAMRPRVREAMKDLERTFARAKRAGQPAVDPSWLRDQLGVHEDD